MDTSTVHSFWYTIIVVVIVVVVVIVIVFILAAPAALLVAVDNQLIYYGIEEEADLGPGFTTNEEKTVLVDTGSFNIIGKAVEYILYRTCSSTSCS